MLKRYFRKLDALHQMQRFLDEHSAELRGWNSGGARISLDEITAELDALALAQGTNDYRTKGERKQEEKLATELRHKYFRVLITRGKTREFADTAIGGLAYPWRRTNTTSLVIAARAAIKVTRPFAARLAPYVGKDFFDRFADAADELEASTVKKGSTRNARTGTTQAIDGRIKRATLIVGAVDSLVRAKLGPRSPLLASWKPTVRMYRNAGRKKMAKTTY